MKTPAEFYQDAYVAALARIDAVAARNAARIAVSNTYADLRAMCGTSPEVLAVWRAAVEGILAESEHEMKNR